MNIHVVGAWEISPAVKRGEGGTPIFFWRIEKNNFKDGRFTIIAAPFTTKRGASAICCALDEGATPASLGLPVEIAEI